MWTRVSVVALLSGLVLSCGAPRNEASSLAVAAPLRPPPRVESATVPPPRDDGRLPPIAAPVEYRLHLRVDPAGKTFSGKVTIPVRLAEPTRVIVLHGRKLRIQEAEVTSEGRTQSATTAFRPAAGSKGDADELVLTVGTQVEREASLDLVYEADFAEGLAGLYRVDEGGKAYAFTQFEPFGARLAFPCFDEPSAKVPFEVALTVPAGLLAVSNMPVRTESPDPGGKTVTFSFEKSPPLPTYLVALAVGPLEARAGASQPVPLRLLAVAGRAAMGQVALDAARDQLKVLEEYFGTKYPYPKLDLVAVPNFGAGAMENAGLITFREERLLVDEKTTPTALRRAAYLVIAHELSHMWFGDLVTMAWWDDIWLNEGFATWMASKVLDTWRPELRARVEAYSGTAMAMTADTLDSARRVRQPVRSTTETLEAFDGITYQKGAALLDMVERWVTPEAFRAGIVRYLEEHRFGNATSEDLFAALAAASGKPVPEVLQSFTEQTGVPAVELSACRVVEGLASVGLRQSEYRPLGAEKHAAKAWTFPVCVRYPGQQPGQKGEGQACALVRGAETTLSLPGGACPAWIHPNADQSGYYRVTLPEESFERLASLPRAKLTPRERVGVLSDAWAVVRAGGLDVPRFLELARRFQGDPEPAVWDRIVSSLQFVDAEMIPPALREPFSAEVRKLLAPEVRSLGFEPRPRDGDHERMRRRVVLTAMGALGRDPQVLARAQKLASAWLDDPRSVQGDLAAMALPLAAMQGDGVLFDRIVKRLKAGVTPEDRVTAVSALGEFRDPALVGRAIELLSGSGQDAGTIRTQDQLYVLRGLFSRGETRSVAFQAVAARLDAFLDRIPPFARRRIVPILAEACGEEESARARALIAPRLASLEGADRGFLQAQEVASRCGAFRQHHAPVLARWLSGTKKK
jgi:aminopeptidase N